MQKKIKLSANEIVQISAFNLVTTHVSSKNTSGYAILSSSKCFIRKFGVDKCKKFEEIVQTKECDFKSLADVRDEKRTWSP